MKQNALMPLNSPHTNINLFRSPYKKKFILPVKTRKTYNEFKFCIDISFDTFLESYNRFLARKMTNGEDFYKDFGIPGPSQYKAFNNFYKLFKDEENEFINKKIFFLYDLAMMDDLSNVGILEFIENLTKFNFDGQDKKVVIASGSFWAKKLHIRKKVISCIEILYNKGIEVEIHTQAKEDEKYMSKLKCFISKKSRIGLEKRIPIHFIRCGNDYYFIEFPHTESISIRLSMFLDLNKVELKPDISKAKVLKFFDNLISKASK
jgi:hypothetical protein